MKEILSAIPTFSKYQLFLLALQSICIIIQFTVVGRSWKSTRKWFDVAEDFYIQAKKDTEEIRTMKIFADTTFCACESCMNRECLRKLTRLTIADAVRMGVPIRVANFMDDCYGYTEEDEE